VNIVLQFNTIYIWQEQRDKKTSFESFFGALKSVTAVRIIVDV